MGFVNLSLIVTISYTHAHTHKREGEVRNFIRIVKKYREQANVSIEVNLANME